MLRPSAALALTVLALAGCNVASAASAARPQAAAATPSLPCTLPYGTQVALLSPVPGAPLIVAASRDLPKTVTIVARDGRGTPHVSASLERTAAPPHAHPPFPHPVYYRAGGVRLRPHHHYTVALDDLAQNGCAPYAAIGNARVST